VWLKFLVIGPSRVLYMLIACVLKLAVASFRAV